MYKFFISNYKGVVVMKLRKSGIGALLLAFLLALLALGGCGGGSSDSGSPGFDGGSGTAP